MPEIIHWLIEQFVQYSEKDQMNDKDMGVVISLLDITSLISIERLKMEEETNTLIRLSSSLSMDLYILLNPILYWLNFSVESENRLHLF